ncbi:MAG: VPLPA-CTERM sorting domain-containing protein, partial [Thermodesulfobacteriota bacterium]|nr:VPLPA-CTERM sorting domain-containing protein [Thermodesulfobacteriota bacterium]
ADSDAWLGSTTITGASIIGTASYTGYAEVWNDLDEHQVDNTFPAYASVTRAMGAGDKEGDDPYEETWAEANGNGDWARAWARSETQYTLLVTGSLSVTQLWGYSQMLEADAVGDYSKAYSQAYFSIYYAGGWHDYVNQITNELFGADEFFTDEGGGEIQFTIDLEPGEYLVKAGVYNTAYAKTSGVPVPAAIWLLGSGLIGLVGLRRKNKS